MATLKGSKTHENLKAPLPMRRRPIAGILYFARQADVEGYPEIAGLFRDTAEGEAGHAHGHLDYLREVGDPATGMPIGTTASQPGSRDRGRNKRVHQLVPRYGGNRSRRRVYGDRRLV